MKVRKSTLPIVVGIGLAVTACSSATGTGKPAVSQAQPASSPATSGSPTTSAAASSPAAVVPAGYTRVGGAAQGISIAAPASWVAINLSTESIASATKRVHLNGVSAAQLAQDLESLQQLHAVILYDVTAAADSPQHVTPNINAYCNPSGVTNVGAGGVPLLKEGSASEFQKSGATHITQQLIEVGGVPGVETSYQLSSSSGAVIDGSQLEVLPKSNEACFVTLTGAQDQSESNVLRVAAATAQFP
jgi:hypothetical protein